MGMKEVNLNLAENYTKDNVEGRYSDHPRLSFGWHPPVIKNYYFGTGRFEHARLDINTESEQGLMDCISDVETKRA
jgi:hypothetical protein